jgi:hypothetical protein
MARRLLELLLERSGDIARAEATFDAIAKRYSTDEISSEARLRAERIRARRPPHR